MGRLSQGKLVVPLQIWQHRGYRVLALASLALTVGTLAYPLAVHWGWLSGGLLFKAAYAPVCHQIPERSFHLFHVPVAVCERCFSVYAAFTAMVLATPFIRWNKRTLSSILMISIALMLPMFADWAFDVMGVWHNTWVTRMLTGLLGGIGIGYIGIPAWLEATTKKSER